MKASLQMKKSTWEMTRSLIQSVTANQLDNAAKQAWQHKPVTDASVKELLKVVRRVGGSGMGSSEKKWFMHTELKSATVYHGSPILFCTLNPGHQDSPIALYYAGEEIDVKRFYPE